MSSQHTIRQRSQQPGFIFIIGWMFANTVSAQGSAFNLCFTAEPVAPHATASQELSAQQISDVLGISIPEPGIQLVHVSTRIQDPARATVAYLGEDCAEPDATPKAEIIEETPRGLLLRIREPGTFFFEVSSEDPSVALTGYKLQTAFAGEPASVPEVVHLGVNPPESCDSVDVPRIFPDLLAGSGSVVVYRQIEPNKDVEPVDCDILEFGVEEPVVVVAESTGVPLRAELYSGSECRPWGRIDEGILGGSDAIVVAASVYPGLLRWTLQPLTMQPVFYTLGVTHYSLCAGGLDDHGDSPWCATPLGLDAPVDGRLDSREDDDYFTFELAVRETIEIAVTEGIEAVLSDDGGQELTSTSECGAGQTRQVRTLGPGRYFLRVSGSEDASGPYTVQLGKL